MMKKVKFKNYKNSKKDIIVITVLLTFLLTVFITYKMTKLITDKIIYYSEKLIIAKTDIIYNNSFKPSILNNINTNDLITVIKNSKDEILEVNFNIDESEKILMNVINEINKETNNELANGYLLEVPLGYITNTPMITNLGPKIPVKIIAIDVVFGNVKTKIKEYGINNALLEVYLEINLKINSSMPIIEKTHNFSYNYLLASKVINGKVPDFYGGIIEKQSDTFKLPITENL